MAEDLTIPQDWNDIPPRAKKKAFLEAFSRCGSVTDACLTVGIDRSRHYDWMKQADYKAEFDEAQSQAARSLEDVAMSRAFKGSDVLTIFLLKCRNPEVFGEKSQIAHTGPGGSNLVVRFVRPGDKLTEDGS